MLGYVAVLTDRYIRSSKYRLLPLIYTYTKRKNKRKSHEFAIIENKLEYTMLGSLFALQNVDPLRWDLHGDMPCWEAARLPRSPDFNILDVFLRGYVKSLLYTQPD